MSTISAIFKDLIPCPFQCFSHYDECEVTCVHIHGFSITLENDGYMVGLGYARILIDIYAQKSVSYGQCSYGYSLLCVCKYLERYVERYFLILYRSGCIPMNLEISFLLDLRGTWEPTIINICFNRPLACRSQLQNEGNGDKDSILQQNFDKIQQSQS